MSPDAEFNFKHNGMVDKLKNEERQVISNKKTMMPHYQKKDFPSFDFRVFFANISSKILKHMSKDTEFCGKFRDMFQISAKPLLKRFP